MATGIPATPLLKRLRTFLTPALLLSTIGCAQTSVRPLARTVDTGLAPPTRILVYDFAVSETEVKEYQGVMRQQPSNRNSIDRQRLLGQKAADTMAAHLVNGLRRLGFTVERAGRHDAINDGDLRIDGRFIRVDEGNPLRRLVIGFGAGASGMEIQVQVFQGRPQQKILEFAARADSGKMPGAVATVPASSAAPIGVGIGITVGNAATTVFQNDLTSVERMAVSSADQTVRYLSEFFASQGWIAADQARKARIAH
jgi:hypothetical protein